MKVLVGNMTKSSPMLDEPQVKSASSIRYYLSFDLDAISSFHHFIVAPVHPFTHCVLKPISYRQRIYS
ncbi:hypothetical protein FG05_35323 [Fusarium graminearum]|nr:hypothetical protein FG05_35323 [Fusarium graminearum]